MKITHKSSIDDLRHFIAKKYYHHLIFINGKNIFIEPTQKIIINIEIQTIEIAIKNNIENNLLETFGSYKNESMILDFLEDMIKNVQLSDFGLNLLNQLFRHIAIFGKFIMNQPSAYPLLRYTSLQ